MQRALRFVRYMGIDTKDAAHNVNMPNATLEDPYINIPRNIR